VVALLAEPSRDGTSPNLLMASLGSLAWRAADPAFVPVRLFGEARAGVASSVLTPTDSAAAHAPGAVAPLLTRRSRLRAVSALSRRVAHVDGSLVLVAAFASGPAFEWCSAWPVR